MDRRIQKTRTAIKNAYFSLLMEKENAHITISEIARRANIDRKTFYLHYDSVDGIVKEFSRDKTNEFIQIIKKDAYFENTFNVSSLIRAINYIIEQDIPLYRHIANNPDYKFFWDQIYKTVNDAMKEMYADIIKMPLERLDIYIRCFSASVLNIYMGWLREEIPFSLEELGEITGEAVYFGIQRVFPRPESV